MTYYARRSGVTRRRKSERLVRKVTVSPTARSQYIRPSRVYIPGEESVGITRRFEALRRCRSGQLGEREAQEPRKARMLASDVRMSAPLPTDRPTFAMD